MRCMTVYRSIQRPEAYTYPQEQGWLATRAQPLSSCHLRGDNCRQLVFGQRLYSRAAGSTGIYHQACRAFQPGGCAHNPNIAGAGPKRGPHRRAGGLWRGNRAGGLCFPLHLPIQPHWAAGIECSLRFHLGQSSGGAAARCHPFWRAHAITSGSRLPASHRLAHALAFTAAASQ